MALTPALVVLVHGANHGAWCWSEVIHRLESRGHDSTAVDLPLTSFDDDVDAVRSAIAAAGERSVIVVAHSYAGLVVSAGAHDTDGLLFIAARMPSPTRAPAVDPASWQSPEFQSAMIRRQDGALVFAGDPAVLYNTTPRAVAADAASRLRPMYSSVPERPIPNPAWMTVPSTYVVCKQDRVIAVAAQRAMAARADRVFEIESDHSPFLSAPDEITDIVCGRILR
ncbi:alpha/beta fold hydrolase [Rhodococcus pyridinivorans]|uniref:alpha/beta fold hydrolase n=1 Tax=Rhodococcus pyridinivorans TaxID=103816 RepID=UPI001E3DA420|nr:alpha/beta fold hydrolase [Rhodococcus pyridinivorans]MCD5422143.1 alpha/beta fold hydrolase [Rhodococcus pyridinivorans]